jgi:hypothetical protein
MVSSTRDLLVLSLVTVPAWVKTILDITITVGVAEGCKAVAVVEFCIALTATAPDEAARADVKQYMTSKLLVCQALLRVSKSSIAY